MSIDVSVIIPAYNAADHIDETLDSLKNQDFENFELVIVNDGSTDNTLDIIESSLGDSGIRHKVISQENRGVGSARNAGIENADGKYIVFVDDDDIVAENHISCLFGKIQGNDASFTEMLKITERGEIIDGQQLYLAIEGKSRISARDLIGLELRMEIPFSFCQLMYRKDLIESRFSERAIYGEDTDFALRNLIGMKSIGICDTPTYFYRQRRDSATGKADFRRFEIVGIFENLAEFYRKRGCEDLADLIETNRIPKAIFGNLMYFFHYNYDFQQTMDRMNELDLLSKLGKFQGEGKFKIKIGLFLLNPKLYYKLWKRFKDGI